VNAARREHEVLISELSAPVLAQERPAGGINDAGFQPPQQCEKLGQGAEACEPAGSSTKRGGEGAGGTVDEDGPADAAVFPWDRLSLGL